MELVRDQPVSVQREWIEPGGCREADGLSVSRQCALSGVARSWVYRAAPGEGLDELDQRLLELIDAQYMRRPSYGSRGMVVYEGSFCRLTAAYGPMVRRLNEQAIGRLAMRYLGDVLARDVAACGRLPADRYIDVDHRELVRDPIGSARLGASTRQLGRTSPRPWGGG